MPSLMPAVQEMSKADEVARLDAFIEESSSNSYLRPLLTHLRPTIVTAIRNDFIVADFNPHMLEARARDLKKANHAAEERAAHLRDQIAFAERRLESLRLEAGQLAEKLDDAACAVRRLSVK